MNESIKILEQDIANKIAAGEVIERPASVIKELLENSIDAGSTSITIEIKNAGINYIRITDNGSGINNDDVLTAFERHATNKIKNVYDLFNINTLGFRGEALSSIAAVSHTEIITKTSYSDEGKRVGIKGGKVINDETTGAPNGTTVIVRNLFYNTPARLKFLNTQGKETSAVSDIVNRLIMANPNISFKFINNEKLIIQSLGNGDILTSIICVYGKEIGKSLTRIEAEYEGIKIKGYLGKPELSKNNRRNQSFYVNSRYVKSPLISQALDQGYKTMNMIHKYPFAVLYLDIPPNLIDVNVHPSKTEIRFETGDRLLEFISDTTKKALLGESVLSELKDNNQFLIDNLNTVPFKSEVNHYNFRKKEQISQFKDIQEPSTIDKNKNDKNYGIKKEKLDNNTNDNQLTDMKHIKIIGRIFSTYIIIEDEEAVYLVDQHAAHERLLYEEYMEMFKKQRIYSQRLMMPLLIDVTTDMQELIMERRDLINKFGFEYEIFSNNSVVLREVPIMFNQPKAQDFFNQLLDVLQQVATNEDILPSTEKDIIRLACKSAVKGNAKLENGEIRKLLNRIINEDIPPSCPHGRPIITKLTRYDLEKMFKRVQ